MISPSGKEAGPFLSVEQAAFSHVLPGDQGASVFAWANLAGSFSGALGVLLAGGVSEGVRWAGTAPIVGYRSMVFAYAVVGVILTVLFSRLGPEVEWVRADGPAPISPRFGLGRESRPVVFRLAGLFVIDSFAGGFVIDGLTFTGSTRGSASVSGCWDGFTSPRTSLPDSPGYGPRGFRNASG